MSRQVWEGSSEPSVSISLKRITILFALASLVVSGCAPRLSSDLPSAGLVVETDSGRRGRAQAVWIGNRMLTAAHVLVPDFDDPALRTEFWLNGERVRILRAKSGDLNTLARYSHYDPQGAPPNPSDWIEDWVVAEVSKSGPSPAELCVCDHPIRFGDRLYIVGFPPSEDAPSLQAIPLTALEFYMEKEWEEDEAAKAALKRVVAVRISTGDDLKGWSGSFVGRYRRGKWCYVGLLIAGVDYEDGRHTCVVLRPPPEALRMLMGQDAIGDPVGESGRSQE